ncbi:hypothetical protein ACLOJK_024599 [Asimina triloba]
MTEAAYSSFDLHPHHLRAVIQNRSMLCLWWVLFVLAKDQPDPGQKASLPIMCSFGSKLRVAMNQIIVVRPYSKALLIETLDALLDNTLFTYKVTWVNLRTICAVWVTMPGRPSDIATGKR